MTGIYRHFISGERESNLSYRSVAISLTAWLRLPPYLPNQTKIKR
jgi:hypothetical protein